MKTERQKAIKKLDTLFSEYIRKRAMKLCGGCQRCHNGKGSWKELQAAHFHSRRKYSTRWNEDNAVGLCGGCHIFIDSHPQEKIDFFRDLLGDNRFISLAVTAQMTSRNSATDYKLIEIYFKQKIQEIDEQ